MPKSIRNTRLDTYNKLRIIKKSSSKDVAKLQLEDLEGIIENIDFKNILFLRKCIKSGNPLDYFNEDIDISKTIKKEEKTTNKNNPERC